MRIAGALFTVLALLAVQAPWVACGCGDGSVASTWLGVGSQGLVCLCDHEDPLGHHHDADCPRHHHHHHHHHDGDDHDDHPERHVAFQVQINVLPTAVTLDVPELVYAPLALHLEPEPTQRLEEVDTILDTRPPGDPVAPSVRTEQLLL